MPGKVGLAKELNSLKDYLVKKNIYVELESYVDYKHAASKFKKGKIDAMFSGSGVAAIFILNGLAGPMVRPLRKDGGSFYHAVIIARVGAPKFKGMPDYFKGKRVAFSVLASSGEFYYKALTSKSKFKAKTTIKVGSHFKALEALLTRRSDLAIVKNLIWEALKTNYQGFTQVGQDYDYNPDNTLIISTKYPKMAKKRLEDALISLRGDESLEAQRVKKTMKIFNFIRTSVVDFSHTIELLKLAGATKLGDL